MNMEINFHLCKTGRSIAVPSGREESPGNTERPAS